LETHRHELLETVLPAALASAAVVTLIALAGFAALLWDAAL